MYAFLKSQHIIQYLSLSYVLRAVVLLAPAIYVYNVNIEYSVWLTGPIKVFIIPLNFLFVRKLFDKEKGWKKNDILHFIPFILDCLFTFWIAASHANDVVNDNQLDIKEAFDTIWEGNYYYTLLSVVGRTVGFIQWIVYSILTIPLIKSCLDYQKNNQSQINHSYHSWLKGIVILFMIMGLFEGLAIFGLYNIPIIFLSLFLLLIVYAFYFLLFTVMFSNHFSKNIIQSKIVNQPDKKEKENQEWLKDFKSKELFLDPSLTLKNASIELGIPQYKLTSLIQDKGYSNFYSFVNHYRIERSKNLLKSLPNTHALESIITDSGFNSRSTYFRVFKEFTKKTPGEYLSEVKNKTI